MVGRICYFSSIFKKDFQAQNKLFGRGRMGFEKGLIWRLVVRAKPSGLGWLMSIIYSVVLKIYNSKLQYRKNISQKMGKAFILVLRRQHRIKLFIQDLKKVVRRSRRDLPPIPCSWGESRKMTS